MLSGSVTLLRFSRPAKVHSPSTPVMPSSSIISVIKPMLSLHGNGVSCSYATTPVPLMVRTPSSLSVHVIVSRYVPLSAADTVNAPSIENKMQSVVSSETNFFIGQPSFHLCSKNN